MNQPSNLPQGNDMTHAALRLQPSGSALLIVDLQHRLVPVMHERAKLQRRASRLIQGGNVLGVPHLVTEQYPRGLGGTIEGVAQHLNPSCIEEKTAFSAVTPAVSERLEAWQVDSVVVAGVEAHICVLRTCLDLILAGYRVYPVWDAISSRREEDKLVARERLTQAGAVPMTVESVLFEWLGDASDPRFAQVQGLIKGEATERE